MGNKFKTLYNINKNKIIFFYYFKINIIHGNWGLGIGDWGLGIGDWAQSPIPIPMNYIYFKYNKKKLFLFLLILYNVLNLVPI